MKPIKFALTVLCLISNITFAYGESTASAAIVTSASGLQYLDEDDEHATELWHRLCRSQSYDERSQTVGNSVKPGTPEKYAMYVSCTQASALLIVSWGSGSEGLISGLMRSLSL